MDIAELTPKNILKAADILELHKKESLEDIKNKYRILAKKWHPDQCQGKQQECRKKMEEISWAYEIIKSYCRNYLFSFKKGNIMENLPRDIQDQEKLRRQFGNDPLWG